MSSVVLLISECQIHHGLPRKLHSAFSKICGVSRATYGPIGPVPFVCRWSNSQGNLYPLQGQWYPILQYAWLRYGSKVAVQTNTKFVFIVRTVKESMESFLEWYHRSSLWFLEEPTSYKRLVCLGNGRERTLWQTVCHTELLWVDVLNRGSEMCYLPQATGYCVALKTIFLCRVSWKYLSIFNSIMMINKRCIAWQKVLSASFSYHHEHCHTVSSSSSSSSLSSSSSSLLLSWS